MNKIDKKIFILIIGIIILLITIFAYYKSNFINFFTSVDPITISSFGDFISGILAILSLFLVYFIYSDQRKQIESQNFSLVFSNLLNNYNNLVNNLTLLSDNHQKKEDGRNVFYSINKEFKKKYNGLRKNIGDNEDSSKYNNLCKDIYEQLYTNYYYLLDHYFRYLYYLLNYIDTIKININEKYKYINILKSQMSSDELGLLFFHAVTKPVKNTEGKNKFYYLLSKYEWFEFINIESLLEKCNHEIYPFIRFKFLDESEIDRINFARKKLRNILKKIK